ncbi:uncharacterized protein MYCFIDRAFT_183155 [Pseudocercospora fijiensis CIRAD86]|uniref:ATPase inhibitor, mitochondrial n=1 Tax=Pseudocercospora fijiensis (strain CIRAD86) TaxID=383855 RepID=M3A885_PSEFD|nr:uncharacterized protein MYCFIDRAFT_183155 [Pseudocercospora fijiensis CIRAD86]EME80816.1 hypothetical protein MYCFIDRAFT_183155 [Pseudocercospora fijiensis CIRAD86]
MSLPLRRLLPHKPLHIHPPSPTIYKRPFTLTLTKSYAEGDTGAPRLHGDSWTKREKAAEDMYIKGRENNLIMLLKEKIAAQEAVLEKDRAILAAMEDQYAHVVEGTFDTGGKVGEI